MRNFMVDFSAVVQYNFVFYPGDLKLNSEYYQVNENYSYQMTKHSWADG